MPRIIDAAVGGDPRFVRRRDGREVVAVSDPRRKWLASPGDFDPFRGEWVIAAG
jgi:hypothetical protein